MGRHAEICDSSSTRIGEMVCFRCHKPITEGLYLSMYYSVSSRGNEDDFTRQWHRECLSDHPAWEKYERDQEEARKKAETSVGQVGVG